jgi:hypothetical protein
MPGSGSLVAALHLYNGAPKDGTTLGVLGGGIVVEPLLGNPNAAYDSRRFTWIGGRSRDNFLCVVWHTVPVRTTTTSSAARPSSARPARARAR